MPTTITAYTFDELTGAARERALKALPDADCDITLDECMDSLRALCKVAGVTLHDWSIGPYSHSFIEMDLSEGVRFLRGFRAFAWIENNIFGKLRQPWSPATVPPSDEWARIHGKYSRRYTRPDHVPSCPLTGVCFDEDILDVFRGTDPTITIEGRFDKLARVISGICEADIEYQDSAEGRAERAESVYDDALFDEQGDRLK